MPAFPFPARRRPRAIAAVLAAAAGVACGPATVQAMEVEQISRADGIQGASPIESHGAGAIISDDGTTAYMTFSQTWGTWTTAQGLWKRDLVTNRSTRILGGIDAYFEGFVGSDGKVVGLVTRQRLSPADTNNADDVYLYDTTTRQFQLVSRLDGQNGAAAGSLNVISPHLLTRDGKVLLFATADGVQRRDLTTGRTVKVADGLLGSYGDENASADGTVFTTQAGLLVSPRGAESIRTPDAAGERAFVSPDGRQAVVTARRNRDDEVVAFHIDLTTGQRTTLDLSMLTLRAGNSAGALRLGNDGRLRVLRSVSATSSEIVDVVPTTGAATRVATYGASFNAMGAISPDGRFATLRERSTSFAASADGVSLPGGTDLPSPGIYFVAYEGCRASGFPWYSGAQASALSKGAFGVPYLPSLRSLGVRLTQPSGEVIAQSVISGTGAGKWPVLPLGGPFRLTAIALYADGRRTTEAWTIQAPSGTCAQGF